MTHATLEDVYTRLAEGIDIHGPEQSEMFLAKVCLLLSEELGDAGRALALIEAAQINMKGMRRSEP
jgi:hypothetical protein